MRTPRYVHAIYVVFDQHACAAYWHVCTCATIHYVLPMCDLPSLGMLHDTCLSLCCVLSCPSHLCRSWMLLLG